VAGDEDVFDRGTKALPGRMTIVESYTLVVLKYKSISKSLPKFTW
jgi:hypothetical protein